MQDGSLGRVSGGTHRHMLINTFSFVSNVRVLITKPGSGIICSPLGWSPPPPKPLSLPPASLDGGPGQRTLESGESEGGEERG